MSFLVTIIVGQSAKQFFSDFSSQEWTDFKE